MELHLHCYGNAFAAKPLSAERPENSQTVFKGGKTESCRAALHVLVSLREEVLDLATEKTIDLVLSFPEWRGSTPALQAKSAGTIFKGY